MPCAYGESIHEFRITMNCNVCGRHTELFLKLRCRAHEYGDVVYNATPREVGCWTCKRQLTLYFYCEPLAYDRDSIIRHRRVEVRFLVRNIDYEP